MENWGGEANNLKAKFEVIDYNLQDSIRYYSCY